jgi:hypothetical protein
MTEFKSNKTHSGGTTAIAGQPQGARRKPEAAPPDPCHSVLFSESAMFDRLSNLELASTLAY